MANSDNLGLYLPSGTDYVNVTRDLTNNYQKIDEAFGKLLGIKFKSILSKTALTDTYVTKNLAAEESFSNYDLLYFVFTRGNWVLATTILNRSLFTGLTGICPVGYWSDTKIEYDLKYTSDTSVDVKYISSTAQSDVHVRIYGISLANQISY